MRAIVEMYGKDHRVKKMILGALPRMFTSLRVPGMPMHTADVENVIRWLFSPFRASRKQVRTLEAMESASLQLTFIGVCRKNGVDPSEAYQRLLDEPRMGHNDASEASARQAQAKVEAAAAAHARPHYSPLRAAAE